MGELRAGLGTEARGKILCLYQGLIHGRLVPSDYWQIESSGDSLTKQSHWQHWLLACTATCHLFEMLEPNLMEFNRHIIISFYLLQLTLKPYCKM